MIKKLSFGKVDGYGTGRNNCEVVLEVGFREFPGQEPYFTVCASLWNHIHTDIIQGGQCIDSLAKEYSKLSNNKKYTEIMELWKKYHLRPLSQIPADIVEKVNNIIQPPTAAEMIADRVEDLAKTA